MELSAIASPDAMFPPAQAYVNLHRRIEQNDRQALEELYHLIAPGLRCYLLRRLRSQYSDDHLQEVLLMVFEVVQRGELRDPAALPAFMRTIARHYVARLIGDVIRRRQRLSDLEAMLVEPADPKSNFEQLAIQKEHLRLVRQALMRLSERDRQVLLRFYLRGEKAESIMTGMALTETQFRLCKSRAKAKVVKIVREQFLPIAQPDQRILAS